MVTDERLAELQRLADAATRGPWTAIKPVSCDGDDDDLEGAFVYPGGIEDADGDPVCAFGDPGGSGHLFEHPDNPAFIAAARTAVPDLLAEVARMQKELRSSHVDNFILREQIGQAHKRIADLKEYITNINEVCDAAKAEAARLRAMVAKRDEALRPFAARSMHYGSEYPDAYHVLGAGSGFRVTVGDLRRAAKLVS
jgi:hypothetical protein